MNGAFDEVYLIYLLYIYNYAVTAIVSNAAFKVALGLIALEVNASSDL